MDAESCKCRRRWYTETENGHGNQRKAGEYMTVFDVLNLIGGLVLFLYGMNVMGNALEKRAGSGLRSILSGMTSTTFRGFLLGMGITAVIQSSSATTVMVVGFVNSGLMTLRQAIGVIMGANIGTTVTSWLLSLSAIDGESLVLQLLKPTSFTPILALIGIIFYMFQKNPKRKDTGLIFIGFAVLMFGMDTMSDAVAGLKNVPAFREILTLFTNPILGVLAGVVLTVVIQSSSASIGILQALTVTGSVTYGAAIPIIMGQNIGTCVSAVLSAIGTSKNAKRAAAVHVLFNSLAALILLPLYYLVDWLFVLPFADVAANPAGIAVCHSVFNVLAVILLMPGAGILEKLACRFVPDSREKERAQLLDERLLHTPPVAVARCCDVAAEMAEIAVTSAKQAFSLLFTYDAKIAQALRENEERVDMYEDQLGTYLVRLSALDMTEADSLRVNEILHIIGDFERISDHSVNLVGAAEEMHEKQLTFTDAAREELTVMIGAVSEILDLSQNAFRERNLSAAAMVEPLEQVVDGLRDTIKKHHIARLRKGGCTTEMGFVLTDILTDLERMSDHCSNVAGCLIEMSHDRMDMHRYLQSVKGGGESEFLTHFELFREKYTL